MFEGHNILNIIKSRKCFWENDILVTMSCIGDIDNPHARVTTSHNFCISSVYHKID